MSRHERYIPEFVFDNLDGLNEAVKSKGYTMKEVGEAAGIRPDLIGGLRSGNIPPTRNYYNRLAEVLGWEVWE